MSYPLFPSKVGDSHTLFSAKTRIGKRLGHISAPQRILICYQPRLFQAFKPKWWQARPVPELFGRCYLLPGRDRAGKVGIIGHFGVGGPATAIIIEDLAAWGVKECIIVGLAGGISPQLGEGDLVLVSEALRDEGTSYHYLPPDKKAQPAGPLFTTLKTGLAKNGIPFVCGATWTTDAPYRETWREASTLVERGVLTVEMEMASLFSVAQYVGIAAAGLLVVGDRLVTGGWSTRFNQVVVDQRLRAAATMVIQGGQDVT